MIYKFVFLFSVPTISTSPISNGEPPALPEKSTKKVSFNNSTVNTSFSKN